MAKPLELTLFGSPEVRSHGQLVTGFRSSKAQALLYYLAVTGRTHTRPTLAGLFWGDQAEDAARASLSKCLSNLRALVNDAVLVERQTVAFNRHQPYHLDTEDFLAGIGQPPTPETLPTWQTALALYRGDFLEGFYVRDAPDFEQWVLVQRAHYREAVIQGLHTLANYADQQGDLSQAISHTRRLLTLEPWREEAHRQLMMQLARSGQRLAALAQFETCRRVLDEELAVEPDAETIAVAETIRSSDSFTHVESGAASTVRHNLPVQTTPFIGRQRELIEVDRLCRMSDTRLITILGAGGIGKTRLVLEVALRQVEQAWYDIYFVALAAVRENAHIVPAIAETIGFQFHTDGRSPKQQLLDYLRQKKMLLVLDNFEHLLDSAALLHEMLQVSIHLRILVTSRERLQLSSETVFILDGMGFPVSATPQEALTYSAVQLFAETAQHVRAGFTLNAHNVQDVVRICRLVGGMPLALKLAAGWVDLLSVATIADEIQKSIDFLESNLRDLPLRQRSMRATFDSSWQLLSTAEQGVLAQIAVFHGSFDRQAAGEVAGASLRTLAALVAKSWLQVSPSREWYDVHELVKQYGIAKMQVDPEAWTATRVRHCGYYAAFLRKQMESVKAKLHLPEVEQVFDDIQMAWRFTYGFCHLWSNHLDEAENHIQIAQSMAEESGDLTLLARTMTYLTCVYRKRKDSERVRQLASDSLRIAEDAKLLQYTGMARAHYAWLAWRIGDLVETKRQAEAASEDWSRLGQAQSLVMFRWLVLFPLLGVALQEENITDALHCAEQIIKPLQQCLPDELTTLLERAVVVGDDGWTGVAYDLLYQAFQLAQALHYV